MGKTAGHEVGHLYGLDESSLVKTLQGYVKNSDGTYGDGMVQNHQLLFLKESVPSATLHSLSDEMTLTQVKNMYLNCNNIGSVKVNRLLAPGPPPTMWEKVSNYFKGK